MDRTQELLDEMKSGNVACIKNVIVHEKQYLQINAVLFGIEHGLRDDEFIEVIDKLRSDDTYLMDFRLGSVAEAAYCYLKRIRYTGDDSLMRDLLACNFRL